MDSIFTVIGLAFQSPIFKHWAMTLLLIFLSTAISYLISKRILLHFISKVVAKTKFTWDNVLLDNKVFDALSHIPPALIIYTSSNLIFPNNRSLQSATENISMAIMVFIATIMLTRILDSILEILRDKTWSKNVPIRSYIQVIKLLNYMVGAVFVTTTLLNKNPWAFISGLGAMTAIILLVFKDSILGLVAGIQLSANDLVREGDWIEMPQFGADGDVIDVSLNTIKVQNWDKTISSIPVYALVSGSFKNWRGMAESGGRRIKKSLHLDMGSFKYLTPDELQNIQKHSMISENLPTLEGTPPITNSELFRIYTESFIQKHPDIHEKMTRLVRYLQPTEKGLPLEIYIFSKVQDWVAYEAIQAKIIDHLIAVLPYFDLAVFQNPSGKDFENLK